MDWHRFAWPDDCLGEVYGSDLADPATAFSVLLVELSTAVTADDLEALAEGFFDAIARCRRPISSLATSASPARSFSSKYESGSGDGRVPINFFFRNPELPIVNPWRALNSPLEDPWLMERNPYYHAMDTEGNQLPYIDRVQHSLFEEEPLNLWLAQGLIDMQQRHVSSANYTFFFGFPGETLEDAQGTVNFLVEKAFIHAAALAPSCWSATPRRTASPARTRSRG